MMYKYLSVLFLFLIFSCSTIKPSDPLGAIQDQQLKEVLTKAFEATGGLDNWNKMKALKFQKKTELYEASGAIEKASFQDHHYFYNPDPKVHISWKDGATKQELLMDANGPQKKINGQLDNTANLASIENSILASTFVIGIPFKLMDEGVALAYDGTKTLPNDKKVHVVKATYDPVNYEQHSKADIWWHYFDVKDYRQVGYTVQLHDHTSYVENLAYDRVGGFLFTTERKSWRMDDAGNKLYLRAAYQYSNYEVE